MSQRVARFHWSPVSPFALLRIALGWAIVCAGALHLAAQLGAAVADAGPVVQGALAGGMMSAAATALGAVPLLVMRRIGAGTQGALLGLGAGVMLAASVFSLLLPALDTAQVQGMTRADAVRLVGVAMLAGAALLLALDRSLPHSHAPEGVRGTRAVWLFVFAIAVHNIPEGLAIGVAAAQAGGGHGVATGIAAQDVPEGLIVALALAGAGYSRVLSFAVAALSGLVEPLAAMLGALLVSQSALLLPWGLAGAAGAMLFVVSHEIIPESHRRGHETLATAGLMAGFVAMMGMDALLG